MIQIPKTIRGAITARKRLTAKIRKAESAARKAQSEVTRLEKALLRCETARLKLENKKKKKTGSKRQASKPAGRGKRWWVVREDGKLLGNVYGPEHEAHKKAYAKHGTRGERYTRSGQKLMVWNDARYKSEYG